MGAPAFECEILGTAEHPCVVLRGEFDMAVVDGLERDLEPLFTPGLSDIVLDLSGVSFVDSRGLTALVNIWKSVGPEGRVVLRRPRSHVRDLLEVAGVAQLFEVEAAPDAID